MDSRFVLHATGKLLQILALVLLIPTLIALPEIPSGPFHTVLADSRLLGFLVAMVASLAVGSAMVWAARGRERQGGVREGFAIVTFGWLLFTLFGGLPLFVHFVSQAEGAGSSMLGTAITDACFETMSGLSTTGATILTDVEALPRGILFWRCMTHWLGGMGIVTLALVILPTFGVAAYQMFRGEVPGPTTDLLAPRVGRTAGVLWAVYAVLTLAEVVLLRVGGMDLFDSFCHAFGTMATGGFSTRNASVAAYDSSHIDWVIIVFMFLAGVNFVIHYQVLFTGKLGMLRRDGELRFYVGVIVVGTVLCTLLLTLRGVASPDQIAQSFRSTPLSEAQVAEKITTESWRLRNLWQTVRYSAFQVVAITTTTGFCTADFDVWPNALRVMLVMLMFFGGCAGSTGGGMKMIRIMVVLKAAWREVRTMIQPRLIVPVKVGGNALEEKQVANILGFVLLFMVLFVVFTALMGLVISDFGTAATSVIATMCNIGPGLSGVGAVENYAWIPLSGKWILILCMLLGRLEIYTVLIAFSPISRRK